MQRLCERPGCSEPGSAAYGFDAVRLVAWLAPLDGDASGASAGVLCPRHADAMVVPLGWWLDDRRSSEPRLFRPPAASCGDESSPPAPRRSRRTTPQPSPPPLLPELAPRHPGADGEPSTAWSPVAVSRVEPPEARTPLLARAFGLTDRARPASTGH